MRPRNAGERALSLPQRVRTRPGNANVGQVGADKGPPALPGRTAPPRYVPDDQPAVFLTRSGTLTCTKDGDLIAMDFPEEPPEPCEPAETLMPGVRRGGRGRSRQRTPPNH